MLRVCLDDREVLQLLFRAAEDAARGEMPQSVCRAFMSATMMALQKKDGGARRIATGTSFRRLIAKTLARQFGKTVESICSPFQLLSTRAGTDCVGHLSDHVLRSAMMEKLHSARPQRSLAIRSNDLRQTHELRVGGWGRREASNPPSRKRRTRGLSDAASVLPFNPRCVGERAESSEARGIHFRLSGRCVYAVTSPGRSRAVYNLLAEQLWAVAGIRLHTGKTRVWNRAAERSPDMDDLGNEVWNPEGIKILGTPQLVQNAIHTRLEDEAKLWDAISWVPDLQSSWQILLQCASPRCHHLLRTLLPPQFAHYAAEHDEGMQKMMRALLGDIPGGDQEKQDAARLATLRCAWVVWVSDLRFAWHQLPIGRHGQTLPMLQERLPIVAQNAVNVLDGDVNVDGLLGRGAPSGCWPGPLMNGCHLHGRQWGALCQMCEARLFSTVQTPSHVGE